MMDRTKSELICNLLLHDPLLPGLFGTNVAHKPRKAQKENTSNASSVKVPVESQHAPWACRSPRINPPPPPAAAAAAAAAAAVRPFYSNFDWLD
jgi:hypothetical protein